MHFHLQHSMRYAYSKPVFCEPMTLRLRPREDVNQRLLQYRLTVDPTPAGLSEHTDVEGNSATRIWFSGLTSLLSITSIFSVETFRVNPFDFLLDQYALQVPFKYPDDFLGRLTPYLTPANVGGSVSELAQQVLNDSGNDTVAFLTRLTDRIQTICPPVLRETGNPWPAEMTLAQGEGSCRDLTVLFIEVCRNAGLAARFVSGYFAGSIGLDERHLHAWAEVYLPGAGWRGFDPTQGLTVADQHVALASGASFRGAVPTEGTFRGTDAISTFATQVAVQVGDAAVVGQLQ